MNSGNDSISLTQNQVVTEITPTYLYLEIPSIYHMTSKTAVDISEPLRVAKYFLFET